MSTEILVAAVQAAPAFLDTEATLSRCRDLVGKAAAEGAALIVFPEAFLPGYPDWVWRTQPWSPAANQFYARLLDQAVVVPGPVTEQLGAAARRAGAYVVVGVSERDANGEKKGSVGRAGGCNHRSIVNPQPPA
jgi:nitrilase